MGSKSKLSIPYDVIEDHIHCSICLSVMRGSVLTPCGHRYCTRCITEWVGRNHTCPCCNSILEERQLYSDVQFDSFVEAILTERDKAEQNYFEGLFNLARNDTEDTDRPLSQFQIILKNHMQASILSHQKYFHKLREDCHRKIHLLESGIGAELLIQEGQEADRATLKAKLTKNLEESEKLAAEAFDRFLTENLPALDLLPVNISVYIDGKDLRIPDVIIKPLDRLSVIKPIIEAALQDRGDQLISWEDNSAGFRLLFSPLSKTREYDIAKVLSTLDTRDDVHQLLWDSQPFFQCQMRPGSEIVIKDVFKSQSDFPKKCFAQTFRETGPQPVDYFTCENCNFKWICKSCIQSCHLGHQVTLFVKNHTPTWACCYCPKKKTCKLQSR